MVHTYSYGKLNLSNYDAYKGANICRKGFSQARFDTCTLLRFGTRLGLGWDLFMACGEPLNRVLARARLLVKGEHFPRNATRVMRQ